MRDNTISGAASSEERISVIHYELIYKFHRFFSKIQRLTFLKYIYTYVCMRVRIVSGNFITNSFDFINSF